MIHTATQAEYVGHALEAAIRSRVKDRHWYRQHRDLGWFDMERETDRELRILFAIRREAIRQHREQEAAVLRAYRVEKAAHDAAIAASWAAEQLGPGVSWDLPLAVVPRYEDKGDHYVYPGGAS